MYYISFETAICFVVFMKKSIKAGLKDFANLIYRQMSNSKKGRYSSPGDALLKSYTSWKKRLPEIENLIKNPKLHYMEIAHLKQKINNLKQGIETFEKLHPNHVVKDERNSKVIQNVGVQGSLFG